MDIHPLAALLLACRQIYHEAALLLCSENTFVFSRYYMIEPSLLTLNDECRMALREVVLEKLIDIDRLSLELAPMLARITIFALIHNREQYRPSYSHLRTVERLRMQLQRLARVSVCLEYCEISRTKVWDLRKAEANIEEFLKRKVTLSQETTTLLD